ncbi:MAG: hypothetical protein JSS49_30095 [Planctomycetes bacterium]|nr:hypothetical protein [Planctomycetota bacterium]
MQNRQHELTLLNLFLLIDDLPNDPCVSPHDLVIREAAHCYARQVVVVRFDVLLAQLDRAAEVTFRAFAISLTVQPFTHELLLWVSQDWEIVEHLPFPGLFVVDVLPAIGTVPIRRLGMPQK